MTSNKIRLFVFLGALFCMVFGQSFFLPQYSFAQNTVTVEAPTLVPKVNLFFSPRAGTFVEGSTFDVPILINTKGKSINAVDMTINFDKNKLVVVRPSGGTSIIGVWIEPPNYDNTRGVVRYVGVIPGGITTESGLIGTITFQAKSIGTATVSINNNSKVLLNDGLGSEAIGEFDRVSYNIAAKTPIGVTVFSDTHPFQSTWYNNNSPVFAWDTDGSTSGFSYVLDTIPNTIPPNIINTIDTVKSYEGLQDGLWYFHIKANKRGVWGNTGHFLVRIDTLPPALFDPEVSYLIEDDASSSRAFVSFSATDNLSGVDYYEVGVIDKNQSITVSPVFIKSESPFQVPLEKKSTLEVIIRAVDKSGNMSDSFVSITQPSLFVTFIKDNIVYVLWAVIIFGLLGFITHYLVGHHILRHVKRFVSFMRREEKREEEIIEQVESEESHKG
jgi:hypothetical protein